MKDRLLQFFIDRLKESSTWQGVGFLLTITGSHYAAGFDIASATAFGATVSALIKVFFPDNASK